MRFFVQQSISGKSVRSEEMDAMDFSGMYHPGKIHKQGKPSIFVLLHVKIRMIRFQTEEW